MEVDTPVASSDNASAVAPSGDTTTVVPSTTTEQTTVKSGSSGALDSLNRAAAKLADSSSADSGVDPLKPTADAQVQPGPDGNQPQTGDAMWEKIPTERKNTILENARRKGVEEFFSGAGLGKDTSPEQVKGAFSLAHSIHSNPLGFTINLAKEIFEQSPQAKAIFLEQLGLSTPTTVNQPPAFLKDGKFTIPQGSLKSEDGKRVFTEDQVGEILSNFEQYIDGKYGERFKPIEELRANLEHQSEVSQIVLDSRREGSAIIDEMRTLPNWPKPDAAGKNPGEVKIAEYLNAIPRERRESLGSAGSLQLAFNTYLQNDVIAGLTGRAKLEATEDMRRRAAAGAGNASPSSTGIAPTTRAPRNQSELAEYMKRKAGVIA